YTRPYTTLFRSGDVAQGEVVLEPDRHAVEHDRVLQLLGEVLRLEQFRLRGREQRLGDVEASRHEAEEALVPRPLALVTQHLDQELLVLPRQGLALVEAIGRPAHPAGEL